MYAVLIEIHIVSPYSLRVCSHLLNVLTPPPPDWMDATVILILILISIEGLDASRFFFKTIPQHLR